MDANTLLDEFGRMFLVYCQETGYDVLLRALGDNPVELVQNLDTLHNHLAIIYPQLHPPSFNCQQREDGSLVIKYYSTRAGLDPIVIGLIEVSLVLVSIKSLLREVHFAME